VMDRSSNTARRRHWSRGLLMGWRRQTRLFESRPPSTWLFSRISQPPSRSSRIFQCINNHLLIVKVFFNVGRLYIKTLEYSVRV
jgi:hypothetical protein